jgi:hypothetical protein
MKNTRIVSIGAAFLAATAFQASALLSFHAPYDSNFDLTVGSFPQPSATNGSPGLTTGFALNGMPPGSALDVPAKTNGLQYRRVDSYFAGVGNGLTIGSNTFRVLYKPDYSGVQGQFALRKFIFGGGPLGSGDSFALYHADGGIRGPTLFFSIGGVPYVAGGLSNFNWNASTWYYMGVSFDHTGALFYFQPLTNGASATIQTLAFSSTTWGAGFLDSLPVHVGIRPLTFDEGAEGDIDDVKVFRLEKWSAGDFHLDYATIVPEPGTIALVVLAALGLLRRPFDRARNA